jgi:CTP:molybdopterin cytidylyltransferase MocA
MSRIAGILLAAGGGSRYGMPKALAFTSGRLMSERALETLRYGGADPIVAVIGAAADEVRSTVEWGDAVIAENPQWASGMGSSLRTGLSAIDGDNAIGDNAIGDNAIGDNAIGDAINGDNSNGDSIHGDDIDAALILLVDTPGITAAAIARVAEAARAGDARQALLAASYGGKQGHPVLIGRAHWAGVVASAIGDAGAKPYLRAHRDELRLIACDDIADGTDIDAPIGTA